MRIGALIIFSFFFFSCEKDIDLKLDPSENRLVVDANIENGRPPVVFLSKSIDYFSKITPSLLSESFVHNAMVSVSDGAQMVKLIEDTIVNIGGNKISPRGS